MRKMWRKLFVTPALALMLCLSGLVMSDSALQALFQVFQPRESHAQTTVPPCEYSLWDAYHMCLTSCDGWYDVPKEKESCKSGCMWMWQNVRNGNHPSNCHYRE